MRTWLAVPLIVLSIVCLLRVLRHEAQRTVQARVWRPSAPGFEFPELAKGSALREYLLERKDFGVAVAGGGSRGLALAHGAVRALRRAGILSQARYLSTTSGSVWLGVPLYYQTSDSLDALLGESLPPQNLTPEALTSDAVGTHFARLSWFRRYPKGMPRGLEEEDAEAGQAESALRGVPPASLEAEQERARRREAEAQWGLSPGTLDRALGCLESMDLCACLADRLLPDTSARELWSLFTNYIFLQPFGLASPHSSQCHETELERTRSRLGNRSRIYVARDISQRLPFFLSQAAVLAPFSGKREPVTAFPLEHSPLYVGTPSSYTGEDASPYKAVGDVLVETFAWPGEVQEPVSAAAESEVRLKLKPYLINMGQLGDWAAIVTSYSADFQVRTWAKKVPQCIIALGETLLPHVPTWSPLGHADDRGVPIAETLAVGDAGIYDDLGHIPLLRRGVRKMVIYDSSAVHDTSSGVDAVNLCEMTYTIAAFGQPGCLRPPYAAGAPNPNMAAGFSQVFEPSEFRPFWDKVVALHEAGKPVVVRGNYTVVDNDRLGIKGGFQAEILWVILLPVTSWRSQLPERTASALEAYFPNYLAAEVVSRFQMSALSQFASWVTETEVLKELRAMLGEEPAEPGTGSSLEVTV